MNKKKYLVNQLIKQEAIQSVFPLHDKEELKKLELAWYKTVNSYKIFNFIPTGKIFNLRRKKYIKIWI